ncbi:hypothetical protein ONQ60_16915, partial [Salmonella enterica subsp. enterica serovar Virginia]|nr:hypothetical protein [Salmonella enterica subsp. enterica serovar Virginia]
MQVHHPPGKRLFWCSLSKDIFENECKFMHLMQARLKRTSLVCFFNSTVFRYHPLNRWKQLSRNANRPIC